MQINKQRPQNLAPAKSRRTPIGKSFADQIGPYGRKITPGQWTPAQVGKIYGLLHHAILLGDLVAAPSFARALAQIFGPETEGEGRN